MTDAEKIQALEEQVAHLKNWVELSQKLVQAWGTKNNELRRKLRDLGHPEEPFDDGGAQFSPVETQ